MRVLNLSMSRKYLVFPILLFIICPILSLPFIFYYISKRKCEAMTLLSLFMALCSMLWPPTGDLYRHNMMYYEFQKMNINQFVDFISIQFDFVLYLISFLFAKLGLPFEYIRALLVFAVYQMAFWTFRDCSRRNPNLDKSYMLFFLLFFLSVLFFVITQGLRYGFSIYLFAFGIYLYLINKNNIGLFCVILSIFVHYSLTPYLVILLFSKFVTNVSSFKIVILSAICIFTFSSSIGESIVNILPIGDDLNRALLAYTSGYWSREYLDDHSLFYQLSRILASVMMYPLLFFVIKNDAKDEICRYAKCLTVLIAIYYAISNTLFTRISQFFIPIGLYIWALLYNYKWKKYSLLLLSCGVLSFISQIYTFRREATISREYMLFCPVVVSLSSGYTYSWIIDNVYEDGAGKSLKY